MIGRVNGLSCTAVFVAWLGMTGASQAQVELTGRVELEQLGLAFTVPEDWRGQFGDEAIILGGVRDPGLILMFQHEHTTLEGIRNAAEDGVAEDAIRLRLTGPLEALGDDALGARLSGQVAGQAAEVYMVARLNPYGDGVTVMAMTDEANYSPRYEALAREVSASLVFTEVKSAPVAQQAMALLNHTRLNFRESYSSGAAGGYSTQRAIDLCPDMRFQMQGSTSLSVDTGGAFGSAQGAGRGSGTWRVVSDANARSVLELRHDDGSVQRHVVSFDDGRTYLDGERYFRIGPNDPNGFGPRCQ